MEEKKMPHKSNKKDLANELLKRLDQWQQEGDTPNEAIEKLSMKQYDFLIDYGVNLDNLIMTTEQQKAIASIVKSPRAISPNGYKKNYPQTKIDLYTAISNHIQSMGGVITPQDKNNYRDLSFTLKDIQYKIVLSSPRAKKL